jgi:hypothetical protein
MGCDIHLYVEKRDADGLWRSADTWYDDPDYPDRKTVYKWGLGLERLAGPIYDGRNYNLFAVLADVRNHETFVPIAAPRGVPADASPEYAAEAKSWGGDGHSHSWLTLGELLRYDWTQTATLRGTVNPVEWAHWRDYGAPMSWAGAVYGGRVTQHSQDEFEAAWQKVRAARGYPEQRHASCHLDRDEDEADLLAFVANLGGGSPYTQVAWPVVYAKTCAPFWSECIPKLLALSEGRFDDLRIVFFFDN